LLVYKTGEELWTNTIPVVMHSKITGDQIVNAYWHKNLL